MVEEIQRALSESNNKMSSYHPHDLAETKVQINAGSSLLQSKLIDSEDDQRIQSLETI